MGTSKNKDFVQPIVESILDEALSRVDGPNQQNEEGMATLRNVMIWYQSQIGYCLIFRENVTRKCP